MMECYLAIKSHVGEKNVMGQGSDHDILRLQNNGYNLLQMVAGGSSSDGE